jgi:hypothetical protein
MTSPARSFTKPACIRIRPFYQYPDAINGGNAGLFGLCHDIRTVFPTTLAGHPHPRPPGMGKADRAQARVPLPPPHFPPTENTFRHGNVACGLLPPHFNRAQDTFRQRNARHGIGNACVRALFRRLFWCWTSPFVIVFELRRVVKRKAAAFLLVGSAAVFAFAP